MGAHLLRPDRDRLARRAERRAPAARARGGREDRVLARHRLTREIDAGRQPGRLRRQLDLGGEGAVALGDGGADDLGAGEDLDGRTGEALLPGTEDAGHAGGPAELRIWLGA